MLRPVRLFLIVLASLVALVLLASGAAYLLVDPGALAQRELKAQLPALEKKLGRTVTVGGVGASFLPLSATLRDVTIGDASGVPAPEQKPLLVARSISVRVSLLEALLSLGKTVRVTTVTVDGLAVSIVRRADGSLSYQDVVSAAAAGPSPVEPLPEKTPSSLSGLVIEKVELRDASIHFEDLGARASGDIRKANLTLENVGVGRPITVALDLAAFASETNVHLQAEIGPVPADLDVEDPLTLLRSLHLKASGVDLAALAPYVQTLPVRPTSMRLTSDVTLSLVPGRPLSATGTVQLTGAQLQGGEPFDLSLVQDVSFDRSSGTLDLRNLELSIGAVKLEARGHVAGIGKDLADLRLSGVEVRSDTLDLGQLYRYVPVKDPPLTTEGPGRLLIGATGTGESQVLTFALDLTGPRVIVPDTLDKPAGVPLSLNAEGSVDPQTLALPKVAFRFGPVTIEGSIRADGYRTPSRHTIVSLASNTWAFGDLARLVPAVQKGVPAGGTIGGTGTATLKYEEAPRKVDLDASLVLAALALKMPGTTIEGGARLSVKASGDPEGELRLDATADARDATLHVDGKVDKPAGVPLDLDLSLHQLGDKLQVEKAALLLGALQVQGSGTLDRGTGEVDARLSMPPLDVAELARTFPALKQSGIAGGKVTARLTLDGNPRMPATLGILLDDFRYTYGKNEVRGSVHIKDAAAPKIEAELNIPRFHADEVMPPDSAGKAASAARTRPGPPPKPPCESPSTFLTKVALNLNVKMADGRFADVPVKDLDAHLEVRNGRLDMDRFSFKTYGGTVEGHGTHVDLSSCVGEYMADLSLKDLDLSPLLAEQTSLGGKVLSGKMSGRMVVNGKGADRYHMMVEDPGGRRMAGVVDATINNATWNSASLATGALGKLAAMIPSFHPSADHALGTVNASFDLKNGRFVLAQPMSLSTGDSRTELTGSMGMDHSLEMTGTYLARSSSVASATGGRCKPSADVPVPITIGGTLEAPRVAAGDTSKSVNALLAACFGGQLEAAKDEAQKALVEEAKAAASGQGGDAARKAADQARKAGKKLLKGFGL